MLVIYAASYHTARRRGYALTFPVTTTGCGLSDQPRREYHYIQDTIGAQIIGPLDALSSLGWRILGWLHWLAARGDASGAGREPRVVQQAIAALRRERDIPWGAAVAEIASRRYSRLKR
jgi:hypothetical protein